ncbi:hypothetical protein SAMN02910292_01975 [Lachnospiraceae bacterium XBB2008]|nr:hypothetical protein SAMN02910292_01975 [Lachnospiraceae bacterium XBB2008]
MGSFILIAIIALLIKQGMTDNKGISDLGKVLGTVAGIAFIVSLFAHPLLLVLGGVGVIAAIIAIVNKVSGSERTNIMRAHAEEFRQMYNEVYEMKLNELRRKRDAGYERANATERKARELQEERMAREAATKFVDEQIRKKYGDQAVSGISGRYSQPVGASGPIPVYNQAPGMQPQVAPPPKPLKSSILPKASGRRTKIVNKFNEQYNLYLTEEQIRNIVAASYMSNAWKQEVEAMYTKYDSVYQWLVGDTAYLRAYLRAFAVQDVTSDFRQQQQIVTDSFEEIFQYSDTISGLSLERRIEMINSKFLTNFDDITYMIAYRYLEAIGHHHELEKTTLTRIDGTFDDLVAKYENMSTEAVDADLSSITPQNDPGTGTTG